MAEVGFLPCFSKYRHKEYPVKDFYQKSSYVEKAKVLVSAFITSTDPFTLKQALGNHDIQTVRPNSSEGKRIINMCASPECEIHRIDYGNNPFRIIFGLSKNDRNAYIFAVDTKHKTFSGKHW